MSIGFAAALTQQQLAQLNWSQLPNDQSIILRSGYYYAVLVSVSTSYSDDTIKQQASNRGLQIIDWKEQGDGSFQPVDPNTSHRYVHLIVLATRDAGSIPWSSPWPTTIYNVVKAWYVAPGGSTSAPPTAAPPTNWLGWAIAAGAAAAAYGGWRFFRRRARVRR